MFRSWHETLRETERLLEAEARKAGELARVTVDDGVLTTLSAHNRYWKEFIKTLEDIEDFGDNDDFEAFYLVIRASADRMLVALALAALEC